MSNPTIVLYSGNGKDASLHNPTIVLYCQYEPIHFKLGAYAPLLQLCPEHRLLSTGIKEVLQQRAPDHNDDFSIQVQAVLAYELALRQAVREELRKHLGPDAFEQALISVNSSACEENDAVVRAHIRKSLEIKAGIQDLLSPESRAFAKQLDKAGLLGMVCKYFGSKP